MSPVGLHMCLSHSMTLSGMRNEVFKQKMLSAAKIPVQDFFRDLRWDSRRFEGKRMPSVPKR
eukprot:10256-Pelagomonas_calceolata.AAC.1